MIRILISSCLLGQPVRYDGKDALCENSILSRWQNEGRIVHMCPEIAVDFPIPRPPAETAGGDGKMVLLGRAKVIEDTGTDVTEKYLKAAKITVNFAESMNAKIAIMPDGSPSCAPTLIYDGTFTGKKIPGRGVTAELLEQNGVRVFNANQIEEAQLLLKRLEDSSVHSQ